MKSLTLGSLFLTISLVQCYPLANDPFTHTSFKIEHGDGQVSDFDTSISKTEVKFHQKGIPGGVLLEDRFYPHVEPFLAFRKVNLEDFPSSSSSYLQKSQPVKRRVNIQPQKRIENENDEEEVKTSFESFEDSLTVPN